MGRAASTKTEVKMVLEDSDLRNKIKAQQREIKTQEKLLERLGREGKISFTKIEKGAGRAARSIKGAGQAQSQAFGPRAIKQLAAVAAGYVGIRVAVSGALTILRKVQEEAIQAGESLKQAEFGLGSLAELAGGDQEALAKLTAAAVKTLTEGGAATLGEAAATVFQLESASLLEARELAAKFFGIDAPGQLVKGAGVLRASFGSEEAGSFPEIISKSLAGALPAPGVSAADIALAVAKSGPLAKELGLHDEEIFAATSVIAQVTGDAALAATKMVSLLNSLLEQGFGDRETQLTLNEMLQEIRGLGLSKAELKPFFGRKEATFAFLKLPQDELRKREVEIIKAARSGLSRRVVATAEADPLIGISRLVRRQKGQEEAAKIPMGQFENVADIGRSAIRSFNREQGMSEFKIATTESARSFSRSILGAERELTNTLIRLIQQSNPDPEFIAAIKLLPSISELQRRLVERLEKIASDGSATINITNIGQQKNTGVLIGGGQAGAKSSQNFHKDGDTG